MTTRSSLNIYNNVAVTARYRRKSSSSLVTAIFSALATVIQQHPILSVIPVDTDTPSPYFARLPTIDLNQVITWTTIDGCGDNEEKFQALDQFLQEQHNRPFRYTMPLTPFWALHVLQELGNGSHFMLAFFFHHCIADTKSALVFHEAMEDALNMPSEIEPSHTLCTSDLELLPPLDCFLEGMTARSVPECQEPLPNAWTGGVQVTPPTTRFCSRWLTSERTKQLSGKAKEHGVSVTAVLQSMLVAALFRILPSEYTILRADCAISVRPWLPPPVTAISIGCFIDNFSETYHRSSFSWDECRRTKETILRVSEQQQGDDLGGKLRRIADLRAWFESKMGQPRHSALELSNVGRLTPSGRSKDCEIESVLFSQSAGACSAAIKTSAATGRDGRLTLGFSYQEDVVEKGLVERMIEGFESILREELSHQQDTA